MNNNHKICMKCLRYFADGSKYNEHMRLYNEAGRCVDNLSGLNADAETKESADINEPRTSGGVVPADVPAKIIDEVINKVAPVVPAEKPKRRAKRK